MMTRPRRAGMPLRVALLTLCSATILPSCWQQQSPRRVTVDPNAGHIASAQEPHLSLAEAEWARQLSIVERAIAGYHENDNFSEACAFFENLTGIVLHGDGNTLGWFPTEKTASDIPRLRAWYGENHSRLYWDEVAEKVNVRPAKR